MARGKTSHRARFAAAMLLVLGARTATAGDAALDARMLPPVLATDVVTLRLLPASGAALPAGIFLERTEPGTVSQEESIPSSAKNRGVVLVGRSTRLAVLADDVTRAAVLASPRGWGFVFGYEASRVEEGRTSTDASSTHEAWKSSTDERFQFGVGWRLGDEDMRTYEIGLLGSLYRSRGDETWFSQFDTLRAHTWGEGTRRQDLGGELTLRTLSTRGGGQFGCSLLYEAPRRSFAHSPQLYQRRRGVRLDGGWRVMGTPLDDLVVGASLLWSDQSTLVMSYTTRGYHYESERRETVYAGVAFVSVEETIVPGLVLRAGARAPARIGTEGERRVEAYPEGGYGPLSGWEETAGSVRETEFSVGLGARWQRYALDGQLRSSLEPLNAVMRWSLTVLL